jgi:ABC-2 type transport system ATP-binding protein
VSGIFYPGKIYGFVGRNGSGKTVLMKMILGFIKPTSGTIKVNGKQVGKEIDIPDDIGAIIETPGFLPEYSAFQNLKLMAMIRGKITSKRIRETIKLVGLDPDSKKHVGKYSLGMRQRLGIAQAIMEDPQILLLDEPLNGLDNEGVEEMRNVLLKQKDQGKLIIIASHSKEDIDILCDEIFRFDHGKIIGHEVRG